MRRGDGAPAVADDMSPAARAIALLLEHANGRREAGLALPCPCGECHRHRESMVCYLDADGVSLIVGVRA